MSTIVRKLTMYRVSWNKAKDETGREVGPSYPDVVSREIGLRARRSVWDCLPLDTFTDEDAAAREGWHSSPDAALGAERAREEAEQEEAERRVKLLSAALRRLRRST